MSGRFKFRGMTLGGEWVYGNLAILSEKIKPCGMTIDAGYYISNKVGMPFAYPVRPETVGQCTGLKDKNGNLIYEGDWLKTKDGYYCYVVWFDGFWWVKSLPSEAMDLEHAEFYKECEVVGNIHENADLLENEE